jgi:hypothetical protein
MAQCAAAEAVLQARVDLRAYLVPRPEWRGRASAILRELAVAPESLSALQLADLLDVSVRPKVTDLRALLRANDSMFGQVRRGASSSAFATSSDPAITPGVAVAARPAPVIPAAHRR